MPDLPRSGRRPAELDIEILRELGEADMAMPSPEVQPPAIAKIRHQHHLLARLLAEGKRPIEASAISGYSPSRISILQNDPAFQELVEYYKAQVEQAFVGAQERLAALGISTLEELQERLEEAPERFKNKDLLDLMTAVFDRSVAPAKGVPVGGSAPHAAATIVVQFVQPQGELLEGKATVVPELGKP